MFADHTVGRDWQDADARAAVVAGEQEPPRRVDRDVAAVALRHRADHRADVGEGATARVDGEGHVLVVRPHPDGEEEAAVR